MELRTSRLDSPEVAELLAEVDAYYTAVYGGPDDDPLDPAAFAPPHGGFWIAVADRRTVAMGGWSRLDDPATVTPRPTAKLRRMFVSDAVRGRGVGRALLKRIEQDAAAAGIARIVLATGDRQPAAINLYRSHGYGPTAPFGFYADSGGGVFLARDLTAP